MDPAWVGPGDQRLYRVTSNSNLLVTAVDEDVVHLLHKDESPNQISTPTHHFATTKPVSR